MKAEEMAHLIEYYPYSSEDTCIEPIYNGKDNQVIKYAQREMKKSNSIYKKAVVRKYHQERRFNPWGVLKVIE